MKKSTKLISSVLIPFILLLTGPLPAQVSEKFLKPPKVLKVYENGMSIRFIPMDQAFTPSGEINTKFFSLEGNLFSNILSRPEEDGCIRFRLISSSDLHAIWQKSYADALTRTQDIVVARVLRVHPGFIGETMGSLLVLELKDILKGTWNQQVFLVFFGAANFTLGNQKVCYEADQYGPPPEVGDHLIVFNPPQRREYDVPYLFTGPADLIVLKEDQTLQLPKFYRNKEPDKATLHADQFLQWTRELLEGKAP